MTPHLRPARTTPLPSPSLLVAALAGVLAGTIIHGHAAEPAPDKSRCHLFKPTPRAWLREMSTDRPDQTESPYTVDAGHFQLEMDFVNATFDRERSGGGEVRTKVWGVAPLNLKLGLLNTVDLQFELDPYVHSRVADNVANTVGQASGLGDLQTRLKINLWGNDGGQTAFAVMPFVKWPLSSSSLRNGRTEGGAIFVLGCELPAGWGSAVMSEYDFVSNGVGGYDAEYFHTITFSHDLIGKLGGYMELAARVTPESGGQWQGQVDVGLTYALNKNTQFDLGCNFGVTKSAPDFHPFLGLSWRF